MAGWRKIKDEYFDIVAFENGDKIIGIEKRGENYYLLERYKWSHVSGRITKITFKTKSQALSYAENYMANHGVSPVKQVEAKLKRMAGF